jgi:hypothetical protein
MPIGKVLEKINSNQINAKDIVIWVRGFLWDFKPLKMEKYFSDSVHANLNE